MGNIGWVQLLIVLAIVILLFGTKKLRNLGGDLGSAVKSFKGAMKGAEDAKDKIEESESESDVIDAEVKSKDQDKV